MKNTYYDRIIKYIFLFLLIYMPVFGFLETLPIRIWDEARVAINAYEMYRNGDLLVPHFQGEPDMWNTKPPLLIWFQVLGMNLFGVGELAVRLPSAIAAFLTCIALVVLGQRYLDSFWFGFIAVMVLITSYGYIDIHATRTGDYDAMVTLFMTLGALLFFAWCETRRTEYLYLVFLATALGVLTKGITGMMFLPALVIYSLIAKQFIQLLKNKHFYFGLLGFVVLVGGYYGIREMQNPGYLLAVQQNELGGRYLEVLDGHRGGFWYYYNLLVYHKMTTWYVLVPCGLLVGFFIKDKKINKLTTFSSLILITYFLVISTAKTKLAWYDVPMYPFLAIIIAIFLHGVFLFLEQSQSLKRKLRINIIPHIFIFLVLVSPYQRIIGKTYWPKEYPWHKELYEIGYFLQKAVKGEINVNNRFLLYDGYNTRHLFYLNILNDKGVNISSKDWTQLNEGDVVFTHQSHLKDYLETHYTSEVIETYGNVITYEIHGKKEQPTD
jgi:4-amino-4-deoxy-L-arabinose transferase-like glycosyltransferase